MQAAVATPTALYLWHNKATLRAPETSATMYEKDWGHREAEVEQVKVLVLVVVIPTVTLTVFLTKPKPAHRV